MTTYYITSVNRPVNGMSDNDRLSPAEGGEGRGVSEAGGVEGAPAAATATAEAFATATATALAATTATATTAATTAASSSLTVEVARRGLVSDVEASLNNFLLLGLALDLALALVCALTGSMEHGLGLIELHDQGSHLLQIGILLEIELLGRVSGLEGGLALGVCLLELLEGHFVVLLFDNGLGFLLRLLLSLRGLALGLLFLGLAAGGCLGRAAPVALASATALHVGTLATASSGAAVVVTTAGASVSLAITTTTSTVAAFTVTAATAFTTAATTATAATGTTVAVAVGGIVGGSLAITVGAAFTFVSATTTATTAAAALTTAAGTAALTTAPTSGGLARLVGLSVVDFLQLGGLGSLGRCGLGRSTGSSNLWGLVLIPEEVERVVGGDTETHVGWS